MNQSANQEKIPLLFIDEQGQTVSFDNIHNSGVVPKNLIPHSKNQLITTLLHRLEKQNELLIKQRSAQSYLGGLNDSDELDELDELIAIMVSEVNFSKLSTAAKDKLINSLLRRVKKHQQLIENIKQRNVDERERLQAVEMDAQRHIDIEVPEQGAKSAITESEVTDSFVQLISDYPDPEPLPQKIESKVATTLPELNHASANNESFKEDAATLSTFAEPPANNKGKRIVSSKEKYADYLSEMDSQQEQLREKSQAMQQTLFYEYSDHNKVVNHLPTKDSFAEHSSRSPTNITSHRAIDTVLDEDQEEDESQYLFDLKDIYQKNDKLSRQARSVIEVVMMRFDEVVNVDYIAPGKSYRTTVAGKKFKLIKNGRGDKYEFFYDSKLFKGRLLKGENSQSTLLPSPQKAEKRQLPDNGVIRLEAGNVTYLLRRVSPIVSANVSVEKTTNKPLYQSLLGSAVFHFLVLLIGSLFVTLQFDINKQPEPRFVSVEIKDLQPKVVPPKPPKAPKPKVVEAKPKPKVTPKPKPKATQKPKDKPKQAPKAVEKPTQIVNKAENKKPVEVVKVNVKKTGLLATLGSSKSKKSSSKQTLAKVTNLSAVSSLDSMSAKVKVGGISAKVANSRVSIPSGPAIDTQGSMVSGEGRNNIAALNAGDIATGEIRGKVTASLTKKVKIGGGLSREEVKKVIDGHMAEVTYCYEKALVGNANLSGKAVFEWKILQNGSVGQVGIQSSTLQSNKLHSCINGAIKGWVFPQPKGGVSTTVSYPFIFNMVGF